MDEAGAIQYKDKMHIDWLNDFLEWTPILLMVLVAVVFLVALKWRSGRMKKFLEEWFHRALPGLKQKADAGDADAAFDLYDCFHEGLGAEKSDTQALHWLQLAAEQGKPEAMFDLALEYREGGLVEKNEDLFMYWLRKAAEADERDAQYLLAACYEHGNGVPQDLNLAREWYDRAAEGKDSGMEEDPERAQGK